MGTVTKTGALAGSLYGGGPGAGGSVTAAAMAAALTATDAAGRAGVRNSGFMATHHGTVANEAAMLALANVRAGDTLTRTDTGTDWRCMALPSSTLGNWRNVGYTDASVLAAAVSAASDLTTGDTTLAPRRSAVTAAIAAAIAGGGGSGQVKVYDLDASPATVPISTTRGVSGRITIPANDFSQNSLALWVVVWRKPSGTTDTPTFQTNAMSGVAGTPGSSDHVGLGWSISTTNERSQAIGFIRGNRTDQTQVRFVHPANLPDPTGSNLPAAAHGVRTVNTAAAWQVIFTATTSTTDTAAVEDAFVIVFNPDASGGGGGASLTAANTWTKAQTVDMIDLTDGATIAVDASLSNNFRVTLGGNRTLANPTNLADGWTCNIKVKQDGTGTRTLAYGSKWKFPASAPALSTAAGAVDSISGVYDSTDDIILANRAVGYA